MLHREVAPKSGGYYYRDMANCFRCGGLLDPAERVYRNTLCPHCSADVKVCVNCTFFDSTAHWQCRETIPEEVRDKERANFCDYFVLASGGDGSQIKREEEKKNEARRSFDSLFGGDSIGDG